MWITIMLHICKKKDDFLHFSLFHDALFNFFFFTAKKNKNHNHIDKKKLCAAAAADRDTWTTEYLQKQDNHK